MDSAGRAGEYIMLRDGTQVYIRPIQPDDAPKLQALVRRLSYRTMFFRFLGYMKQQSDAQARHLATVDYDTRMAFVAVTPILFGSSEGEEQIIGVARYFPSEPEEPGVAEVGVVVEDEYQGRGLGTLLLIRLARYAAAHGYAELQAVIHTENERILQMIRRSGLPMHTQLLETGVVEVRATISGDLDSLLPKR